MNQRPTILIFDSGLGGLTVFREVAKIRPDASYVYVADDAFFPYAQRSEEELVGRVVPLMRELIAAHGRSSARCRQSSQPAWRRGRGWCRCLAPRQQCSASTPTP